MPVQRTLPNALYTYFPDKASILDALLATLLATRPREAEFRRGLDALINGFAGASNSMKPGNLD